jgi:hypothetical protein
MLAKLTPLVKCGLASPSTPIQAAGIPPHICIIGQEEEEEEEGEEEQEEEQVEEGDGEEGSENDEY